MYEYFIGFIKTTGLVWTASVLCGLLFERFFPAERYQPIRNILFNIKYALIYALFIYVFSPIIWPYVSKIVSLFPLSPMTSFYFESKNIKSAILGGIIIYLITDFFYYWMHRFQHKIPFLWAQHSFHHSEVSVNATTGIRHHWLEYILQALLISIPMQLLFKLPLVSWGIVLFIFSFWSFFIHMNVKLQMGFLTPMIAGPQLHRIHHSIEKQHWDKNFSAYFPIWDILFGTYYHPKKDEFPETGLINKDGTVLKDIQFWQAIVWPWRNYSFWGKLKDNLKDNFTVPLNEKE